MEASKYLEIMEVAEKLKCNTRHSWTSNGRHESVADHSWRLCLMALLMKDEFATIDIDKVIRMCIIHDLGEAITGDIPTFEKTKDDEKVEERLLSNWVNTFPEPYRTEFTELYEEMNAQETDEAKLYKILDNLEALMQHNSSDISTWLPLEYELQYTYGKERMTFAPYIMKLREKIDEQTTEKINKSKKSE